MVQLNKIEERFFMAIKEATIDGNYNGQEGEFVVKVHKERGVGGSTHYVTYQLTKDILTLFGSSAKGIKKGLH